MRAAEEGGAAVGAPGGCPAHDASSSVSAQAAGGSTLGGYELSPELQVKAALDAAAAAAAAAVACATPWHEPPPFQVPAPYVEPLLGGPMGQEAEAEETVGGGVDGLSALRVPSTLRLLSGPATLREQAAVHLASDLPSPVASPVRRPERRYADDDEGGDELEHTLPAWDGHTESHGVWGGRAHGGGGSAGGEEEGGAEGGRYDENYDDDEFETDDELNETADDDDDDATTDDGGESDGGVGADAASCGSRGERFPDETHCDPGAGADGAPPLGGTLSIDELEATLRSLQLQNDEHAVVRDEVEALSGTLRAVAASLAPPAAP
jgi:hypothetical protein